MAQGMPKGTRAGKQGGTGELKEAQIEKQWHDRATQHG